MLGNKNKMLFGIILNNEAIMLESFIPIFCMAAHIFQNFEQFQKVINWCLNSLGGIMVV
jgi:hypothetical protein